MVSPASNAAALASNNIENLVRIAAKKIENKLTKFDAVPFRVDVLKTQTTITITVLNVNAERQRLDLTVPLKCNQTATKMLLVRYVMRLSNLFDEQNINAKIDIPFQSKWGQEARAGLGLCEH
jgi:hypothetical protein